jgi:putrescine transport system substrate-binding protein
MNTLALFILLCLIPVDFAGADESKTLNLYNWADYVPQSLLEGFEDEYGVRVVYNMYESDNMLGAKLLAGHSGYDLVGMAEQDIERFMPLGIFGALDKKKLTNWSNLDSALMSRLAVWDPGNRHAVPYFWGSTGIAYNVDMIRERLPDAPLDSSAMLFDPEVVSHFEDCGVAILDDAGTVLRVALLYLGYHIDDTSEKALADVEQMLKDVRPFVRYFENSRVAIDLPGREVCITMAWNGDYAYGLRRAQEENLDINLEYIVPREGTNLWMDAWIVLEDAPNPDLAHLFLDYLLRPEIAASVSNNQRYANANRASWPFLIPQVLEDPAVLHTPEMMKRIHPRKVHTIKQQRVIHRMWARVKAGFE